MNELSKTLSQHTIERSTEIVDGKYRYSNFAPGTVDQQVRILKTGIEIAKKYYQSHSEKISTLTDLEYAKFGLQFHQAIYSISHSIFDATGQYAVMHLSLG